MLGSSILQPGGRAGLQNLPSTHTCNALAKLNSTCIQVACIVYKLHAQERDGCTAKPNPNRYTRHNQPTNEPTNRQLALEIAAPAAELYFPRTKIHPPVDATAPETQNTRKTPRKRLSRIPQLMIRKHAGKPQTPGRDAILERSSATRNALKQGPSRKVAARSGQLSTNTHRTPGQTRLESTMIETRHAGRRHWKDRSSAILAASSRPTSCPPRRTFHLPVKL